MNYFLKTWVPLFIFSLGIFGAMYVLIQQDYRQSANDPQIQIAEDAVSHLSQGQPFGFNAFTQDQNLVDIHKSLDPFIIFYDHQGKVLSSNLQVVPKLPTGVFTDVLKRKELRFTWQPQSGIRIAAVIVSVGHITYTAGFADNGFVLVGRSLREVERQEDQLFYQVGLGWIATNIVTVVTILFLQVIFPQKKYYDSGTKSRS